MIFTLDEINRAFFETLRLKLVALGHLPDILQYNTESTFQAACNALTKPLITVFGVGSYKARGNVQNNKIIIDRLTISQGSIGFTGVEYKVSGQDYQENKYQQQTENITYQISYVCSENSMDSLIRSIIATTFDTRGKLKGVKENRTLTTDYFLYDKINEADNINDDYIERYMRYEVSNVLLTEPKMTVIPKVNTITIEEIWEY